MEPGEVKTMIHGRTISRGRGKGAALVSRSPLSFYGGVDPASGRVIEKGHELEGETIWGKVFIFPWGEGSTVGSWSLFALADSGNAPVAIINVHAEPVVAVGAIIGNIPLLDEPDQEVLGTVRTGDVVEVNADEGWAEVTRSNVKDEEPKPR